MSIETPVIVQTTVQETAIIHLRVSREEIRKVMGPGLKELMQEVSRQSIEIVGPWLTHHLRNPAEDFDFEITVPVSRPVTSAGRVRPSQMPAIRVARTVYRGPYEGLPQAWGEFEAWIDEQGHRKAADFWEVYAKGPESSPDPNLWETQLNRPLA